MQHNISIIKNDWFKFLSHASYINFSISCNFHQIRLYHLEHRFLRLGSPLKSYLSQNEVSGKLPESIANGKKVIYLGKRRGRQKKPSRALLYLGDFISCYTYVSTFLILDILESVTILQYSK